MKNRVISGIIMALLLIAVLAIGLKFEIVFIIAAIILAILGYNELLMVKKDVKIPNIMKFIGVIDLIALITFHLSDKSFLTSLTTSIIGLVFLTIMAPCVLLHKKNYDTNSGLYLFGSVLFLGVVFNELIVLYLQSIYLFLYIVFVACITDIFALLGGRLIGKHKFTKISPNKTLEGCFVGTIFAIIISTTFYVTFIGNLNIFLVVLMSLVLSIIGQIGDLFFSLIKRENDVKDYGNLIPGHGGILDRLDSILFITMAFVFIITNL